VQLAKTNTKVGPMPTRGWANWSKAGWSELERGEFINASIHAD
jgi:hypothetical protein